MEWRQPTGISGVMISDVRNRFGNFVRWRRAMMGLKKRDLAEKLGIDAKTVTNLERRDTPEGTDDVTLVKLGQALGVGSWLLTDWERAIAVAGDTVFVELPREIYESIARRAAFEKCPDVVAFLTRVATEKTFVVEDRDQPSGPASRLNSPTPAKPDKTEKRAPRRVRA